MKNYLYFFKPSALKKLFLFVIFLLIFKNIFGQNTDYDNFDILKCFGKNEIYFGVNDNLNDELTIDSDNRRLGIYYIEKEGDIDLGKNIMVYEYNSFKLSLLDLGIEPSPTFAKNKFEIELKKGGLVNHFTLSGKIEKYLIISDVESGNDINLNDYVNFFAESADKSKVKFQIFKNSSLGLRIFILDGILQFYNR